VAELPAADAGRCGQGQHHRQHGPPVSGRRRSEQAARLDHLADRRVNVSKGESLTVDFDAWVHRDALEDSLDGVAGEDFSGDIYARWER